MDPDSRLSIIIIVFLFFASAFFALTETALSAVSRNKVKVMSERGDHRAIRLMKILGRFDEAITTLLICTNIAHIAAASMITVLVTRRFGLSAVTLSTFVTTLLMFFLAEMLPKSIGRKLNLSMSLTCSGLLFALMQIFRPLSSLLGSVGNGISKLLKGEEETTVTEEELYDIIEDMTEDGSMTEEQGELISSALSFGDVTVGKILTPRDRLAAIEVRERPDEVLAFVKAQNHSRILVYEDDLDHIIGVLRIRKFLKSYVKNQRIPRLRTMLDSVYFARESMPIDMLLDDMSRHRMNIAVVLDNEKKTVGVVTVEDILEEIVGEIYDESDEVREVRA